MTPVPGAGNPAAWNRGLRNAGTPTDGNAGDNRQAASRPATGPATGEIKWRVQTTPCKGWDHDGVSQVVSLVDKGGNRKFATAGRNGFFGTLPCTGRLPTGSERASERAVRSPCFANAAMPVVRHGPVRVFAYFQRCQHAERPRCRIQMACGPGASWRR